MYNNLIKVDLNIIKNIKQLKYKAVILVNK